MIDWKEIYSQVAPLFDTYYQWQVVFVVGEGLFLIFFNYLAYRYLKKKSYAWVFIMMLLVGNLYYVYDSYNRLNIDMKVVEMKNHIPIGIACGDGFSYSDFRVDTMFTLSGDGISILSPKRQTVIFYEFDRYEFSNEDSIQIEAEKIAKLTYDSLIILQPKLNEKEKQRLWEFTLIEKEIELIREENIKKQQIKNPPTNFIVFIDENIILLFVNSQGTIQYKISDEELKDYIF